jgi:hypothetical protein
MADLARRLVNSLFGRRAAFKYCPQRERRSTVMIYFLAVVAAFAGLLFGCDEA